MIRKKLPRFAQKIAHFIHLQLFLTVISMPILIYWGLPLSILSPVGNFVFGPLLTAFLLISSIIFFTELLHIPNSFFGLLLEWITHFWHCILRQADSSCLIAFRSPGLGYLLCIPFLAFTIMNLKFFQPRKRNMAALFFLLCLPSLCATFFQKPAAITPISCSTSQVTLINHQGMTTVIDPGAVGRTPSAPSWVTHTLVNEVAKKTGRLVIDRFIALKPGTRLFDALCTLLSKITVKEIIIPVWQGMIPKNSWYAFKRLSHIAQEKNCIITRIKDEPLALMTGANHHLAIEPGSRTLKYAQASYKALNIRGFIDNETVEIYAANQAKKVQKRRSSVQKRTGHDQQTCSSDCRQ